MNALELADALDWVCENHLVGIGNADFKATATMLRQQQAEIEALKAHPVKELTYEDGIEECAQRAEAYAYMSPNFTALAEELRAILRKAQE